MLSRFRKRAKRAEETDALSESTKRMTTSAIEKHASAWDIGRGSFVQFANWLEALEQDGGTWTIISHTYDNARSPQQSDEVYALAVSRKKAILILAQHEYEAYGRKKSLNEFVRHIHDVGPGERPDHILHVLDQEIKAGTWNPAVLEWTPLNARSLHHARRKKG